MSDYETSDDETNFSTVSDGSDEDSNFNSTTKGYLYEPEYTDAELEQMDKEREEREREDREVVQSDAVAIGYSAGAKLSRIKDFRVCSAHFSEDDYIPKGGKRKKQILKSFAVPVPRVSSIY